MRINHVSAEYRNSLRVAVNGPFKIFMLKSGVTIIDRYTKLIPEIFLVFEQGLKLTEFSDFVFVQIGVVEGIEDRKEIFTD